MRRASAITRSESVSTEIMPSSQPTIAVPNAAPPGAAANAEAVFTRQASMSALRRSRTVGTYSMPVGCAGTGWCASVSSAYRGNRADERLVADDGPTAARGSERRARAERELLLVGDLEQEHGVAAAVGAGRVDVDHVQRAGRVLTAQVRGADHARERVADRVGVHHDAEPRLHFVRERSHVPERVVVRELEPSDELPRWTARLRLGDARPERHHHPAQERSSHGCEPYTETQKRHAQSCRRGADSERTASAC